MRFVRPPRDGITGLLLGERLALLAWPRAILLQLAHPLVGAGVSDHSTFRSGRTAPVTRLHSTVRTMRRLTFGSDTEADAALSAIERIHTRVHGTLPDAVGVHAAGTRYSAHDPALLLWVHATLIDSHVRVLEELLRPISPEERDTHCRETAAFAVALGASKAEVPATWDALQEYITGQIARNVVCVSPQARNLVPAVLRPPLWWAAWPAQRVGELITVGLLPDPIRTQYGFAWNDERERRMRRVLRRLSRARRWMPEAVARWPEARSSNT